LSAEPARLANRLHLAGCGLRAEERAVEVHTHEALEVLFGDVIPVGFCRDACVGHHHIDTAELPCRLDQCIDIGALTDVCTMEAHGNTQIRNLLNRGSTTLARLFDQVRDNDRPSSVSGRLDGNCLADPAGGAGYDDNLALKNVGVHTFSSLAPGHAPNCWSTENRLATPQCSVILPS
jgi:hypothetical protein